VIKSLHIGKDGSAAWERGFESRPLALDMYGAMTSNAKQIFQQLAQRHIETAR
jgi:hypothetical protein